MRIVQRQLDFFSGFFKIGSIIVLLLCILGIAGTNMTHTNSAYAAGSNLISNPSVETPDPVNPTVPQNWVSSSWGTNQVSFSYPSTNAEDGTRSVRIDMTSYTSGDAKWYFAPVTVSPSTQYTISDYYESNATTYYVEQVIDTSGNYSYVDIGNVPASSTWKQASFTFTTPSNAKQITVFHLIESIGFLQTDNYSLSAVNPTLTPTATPTVTPTPANTPTPTPTPTQTNLVPNPSLEQSSNGLPTSWQTTKWGTNTTAFTYLNTGHTGTHSVKTEITSYTSGDAKWFFSSVPVTPNTPYKFSDYYQSNITNYVVLAYTLSDGTNKYVDLDQFAPSTSWTQASGLFMTPSNATSLTIYHLIEGVGYLITDDYSITQTPNTPFTRPIVTLTFDDGNTGQYTYARPTLVQFGLNGTFNIVSGYIGTGGYMSSSQILQLVSDGDEIASHTVDHQDLTTLTPDQLNAELSNSKTTLQNLIGKPVVDFASPYGSYNATVIEAVKQYYQSHRTATDGFNYRPTTNLYKIYEKEVLQATTIQDVQSWITQAQQQNAWLVIMYHDFNPSPTDQWTITPTQFQQQIQALKNSGLAVETMQQAISEIQPQLP